MKSRNIFNILNVLFIYSFLFLSEASPTPPPKGTADFGGGGNGSKNKVYESNIAPLVKLPIYDKYIKPRLEKFDILMSQLGQSEEKNKFSYSQFLIRMKSWYFTDDTLNSIDKETLGIIFKEGKTQQIALNKKREIWIDNKIFVDMKPQHQADLIIHEFVMNLYFLKYYSFYEICVMGKEMGLYAEKEENNLTCEQIKNVKYFQTKKMMALNEDDYQNIRRVTDWFINDLLNASAEDLFNKLRYNDFDKRLITKSDAKKEFKVTGREVESLLLKLQYSDSFPETCKSSLTNENLNCQISIKNARNPYGSDFNKLEFQIAEGNSVKTIAFNITNKTTSFTLPLQNNDGLPYFTIMLKSNDAPLVLTDEVGERLYFLNLYFSPAIGFKAETAELMGYDIIPYTITSISQPKENSIYTDCEISRLNLKKHSAYSWGRDEQVELILDLNRNIISLSKFYCIVRSQETINQLMNSKTKVEEFMKNHNQQISKVIGKKFEFVSNLTYTGSDINSLKKSYEINSAQQMTKPNQCNQRESKNNQVCTSFKTLKFINEDSVLVDDKYTCNLNMVNMAEFKINSNYKLGPGSGISMSFSCNDNTLVMLSWPSGNISYSNGILSFEGDTLEHNNSFYKVETLYKEIP